MAGKFEFKFINRWKDAVESSSFETLQKLFEFVVKFKDPEVKDTFEDIKPMTKWITPNDMSDALFEVKVKSNYNYLIIYIINYT